ncbi:MAG: acylphosphatase [Candidatus Woykebacteria bacterium]
MDQMRISIKVIGDVHGVGFRFRTVETAQDLDLRGWVMNASDGSVQIVAEGEKEKLAQLVQWVKQGPSFAKVERVETSWEKATSEFRGFEVRY